MFPSLFAKHEQSLNDDEHINLQLPNFLRFVTVQFNSPDAMYAPMDARTPALRSLRTTPSPAHATQIQSRPTRRCEGLTAVRRAHHEQQRRTKSHTIRRPPMPFSQTLSHDI